jgi:salicylate hydroxylase
LAIEDAIFFARALEFHVKTDDNLVSSIHQAISRYTALRAPRIDTAFDEANMRWENVKDSGWLRTIVLEWMTWMWLWWTEKSRGENYRYDVADIKLDQEKKALAGSIDLSHSYSKVAG